MCTKSRVQCSASPHFVTLLVSFETGFLRQGVIQMKISKILSRYSLLTVAIQSIFDVVALPWSLNSKLQGDWSNDFFKLCS